MPKHSKHRCPACDCLNMVIPDSVDGKLYCEHCDCPAAYGSFCETPCLFAAHFECDYWTTQNEKVAEPLVVLRVDCPADPCRFVSKWMVDSSDARQDQQVLACVDCLFRPPESEVTPPSELPYGSSLPCPEITSLTGRLPGGTHSEVNPPGGLGIQWCGCQSYEMGVGCFSSTVASGARTWTGSWNNPSGVVKYIGDCFGDNTPVIDDNHPFGGGTPRVMLQLEVDDNLNTTLTITLTIVGTDCKGMYVEFAARYTGQLNCSSETILSFESIVDGAGTFEGLPAGVQLMFEEPIVLYPGACALPRIISRAPGGGEGGDNYNGTWDQSCWWLGSPDDSPDYLSKHKLEIIAPQQARYYVTDSSGNECSWKCDSFDCRSRSEFSMIRHSPAMIGLPPHFCVEPLNAIKTGSGSCTGACCDEGFATKRFHLNEDIMCGRVVAIPAGIHDFTRGEDLPCGVATPATRCNYFWKTFSYSPGDCYDWPDPNVIGVLIECGQDPDYCAQIPGLDPSQTMIHFARFYCQVNDCYELAGTAALCYSCCDYENFGVASFPRTPEIDCCCAGGVEIPCCPGITLPETILVDDGVTSLTLTWNDSSEQWEGSGDLACQSGLWSLLCIPGPNEWQLYINDTGISIPVGECDPFMLSCELFLCGEPRTVTFTPA